MTTADSQDHFSGIRNATSQVGVLATVGIDHVVSRGQAAKRIEGDNKGKRRSGRLTPLNKEAEKGQGEVVELFPPFFIPHLPRLPGMQFKHV
jgi:hypothetical protein